jgi:hypothetical protein
MDLTTLLILCGTFLLALAIVRHPTHLAHGGTSTATSVDHNRGVVIIQTQSRGAVPLRDPTLVAQTPPAMEGRGSIDATESTHRTLSHWNGGTLMTTLFAIAILSVCTVFLMVVLLALRSGGVTVTTKTQVSHNHGISVIQTGTDGGAATNHTHARVAPPTMPALLPPFSSR